MRLRVTAAGHGLDGGEIPQRLASGLLTVAPRTPLGLLARWVAHKRATTFAAWSVPARAWRRRRGGGAGACTSLRLEGACDVHVKASAGVRVRGGVIEDHVWFEDRWMVASLCDE
jgi:hypothetical protein